MDGKKLACSLIFLVGVAAIAIAIYLAWHFYAGDSNDLNSTGACCKKLMVSGTTSDLEFNQKMMGNYTLYPDNPYLDYSPLMKHPGSYPVYYHVFSLGNQDRKAFLYFYQNVELRRTEKEFPNGCWMLGMYEVVPNNYWFGRKWYYMDLDPAPRCPDHLTDEGRLFTNEQKEKDQGLKLTCVD